MKKLNKTASSGISLISAVFFIWISVFLGGCKVEDKALAIPTGGGESAEAIQSADEARQAVRKEVQAIYVHVCGAVNYPGVVELPEGSRAEAALEAAGGFLETARRDYVNLAEKLADGQKLYFPDKDETYVLPEEEIQTESRPVNINRADEKTLCELPGIGSARARDIIAYREENGGFKRTQDLMKVSGIKASTYDKLADKITVE